MFAIGINSFSCAFTEVDSRESPIPKKIIFCKFFIDYFFVCKDMFYFNSSNIKKNHYAFKKDFLNKTYLHLFQSKHLKNNNMKTNIKFNHFTIWDKAASLLLIALFLFFIPENVKADIPCNTIQSVSYAWPCPNGNQGYFSYCSDGCHVYIKYD